MHGQYAGHFKLQTSFRGCIVIFQIQLQHFGHPKLWSAAKVKCMHQFCDHCREAKVDTINKLLENISNDTDASCISSSIRTQICPRIAKISDLLSEINGSIKLFRILPSRFIESKLEATYPKELDEAKNVFHCAVSGKYGLSLTWDDE